MFSSLEAEPHTCLTLFWSYSFWRACSSHGARYTRPCQQNLHEWYFWKFPHIVEPEWEVTANTGWPLTFLRLETSSKVVKQPCETEDQERYSNFIQFHRGEDLDRLLEGVLPLNIGWIKFIHGSKSKGKPIMKLIMDAASLSLNCIRVFRYVTGPQLRILLAVAISFHVRI